MFPHCMRPSCPVSTKIIIGDCIANCPSWIETNWSIVNCAIGCSGDDMRTQSTILDGLSTFRLVYLSLLPLQTVWADMQATLQYDKEVVLEHNSHIGQTRVAGWPSRRKPCDVCVPQRQTYHCMLDLKAQPVFVFGPQPLRVVPYQEPLAGIRCA